MTRYGCLLSGEEYGPAARRLPLPRHSGRLARLVSEDMASAPGGPDPDVRVAGVRACTGAGFDEVYVGRAGGEPDGFFDFYGKQALPRLREG